MVSVVEGFPCEGATQLLAELREAVQFFLFRMAAIFQNRMQQLIFLINNYDLVLGVLMVNIFYFTYGKDSMCFMQEITEMLYLT